MILCNRNDFVSCVVFFLVTCVPLLVGAKKVKKTSRIAIGNLIILFDNFQRWPNCLLPFMIWICVSHILLHTVVLIYSIVILKMELTSSYDGRKLKNDLQYVYIGTCWCFAFVFYIFTLTSLFILAGIVCYVLVAIFLKVILSLYRTLKEEQKRTRNYDTLSDIQFNGFNANEPI